MPLTFLWLLTNSLRIFSEILVLHRRPGERLLCTPSDTRDARFSQGDSGGPLFQYDGSDEPVLVGVVSIGVECANEHFPGVYVRTSSHVDMLPNAAVTTFSTAATFSTIPLPSAGIASWKLVAFSAGGALFALVLGVLLIGVARSYKERRANRTPSVPLPGGGSASSPDMQSSTTSFALPPHGAVLPPHDADLSSMSGGGEGGGDFQASQNHGTFSLATSAGVSQLRPVGEGQSWPMNFSAIGASGLVRTQNASNTPSDGPSLGVPRATQSTRETPSSDFQVDGSGQESALRATGIYDFHSCDPYGTSLRSAELEKLMERAGESTSMTTVTDTASADVTISGSTRSEFREAMTDDKPPRALLEDR